MANKEVWDPEVPVPMERWGKDHWTTLAYVETRCVDHHGTINGAHMRGGQYSGGRRPEKYPTRLNDGELHGHDDFDCLDDMEAAGLVVVSGRIDVKLTPLGSTIAGKLREHKANGGLYAKFRYALPVS